MPWRDQYTLESHSSRPGWTEFHCGREARGDRGINRQGRRSPSVYPLWRSLSGCGEVPMSRLFAPLIGVWSSQSPMLAQRNAVHPGAKALFYDPATGQAGPIVRHRHPHHWADARADLRHHVRRGALLGFNDRGAKFPDPGSAGLGARVRMHLRGNTAALLTVWMSDSTHASVELTQQWSDAGPEGRWSGYRLARDLDYVVSGEFEVSPHGTRDSDRLPVGPIADRAGGHLL